MIDKNRRDLMRDPNMIAYRKYVNERHHKAEDDLWRRFQAATGPSGFPTPYDRELARCALERSIYAWLEWLLGDQPEIEFSEVLFQIWNAKDSTLGRAPTGDGLDFHRDAEDVWQHAVAMVRTFQNRKLETA